MGRSVIKQQSNRFCESCFAKQLRIDELEEEVSKLKSKLLRQERIAKEGYFGSSTPSSKIPIKSNVKCKQIKKRGAKIGHIGNSRKVHDKEEIDNKYLIESNHTNCPECGNMLESKGWTTRSILEAPPKKAEKRLYKLQKKFCSKCHKTYQAKAPGALKRSLYGNQLITSIAEMHYLHGIPAGRISELTGVGEGAIFGVFKRLANIFSNLPEYLITEYRQSEVKHADETGWRTSGQNGYTWLFATEKLSLFFFGKNRSAKTPKRVLGTEKLPGVLVVDRYAAYNRAPCDIQYCYSHLIRDVENLQKKFPNNAEVEAFVASLIPLMVTAIKLRKQKITEKAFNKKAKKTELEMKKIINLPAKHLGIQRMQELFIENEHRLFHWARNKDIPAENNLAERDIRPTVIARKVSFGSVTEQGAKTRSILVSLLQTLKKRHRDPTIKLKIALDAYAMDENQDPVDLLFKQNV